MSDRLVAGVPRYCSSVYYAECLIDAPLKAAWERLLKYEDWNPTFVGAQVKPISGAYRAAGELVLIKKFVSDALEQPVPDFYAETVKVVLHQHIVWCVYPKDSDHFRNFVDFGLTEVSSGVRFNIYYYEQNHLSGELLTQHREDSQAGFQKLALAFKAYCEANG